jgi:hypothetical protein
MQEGNSFKITERLSPELFAICQEVKNCLEYEENIDFFIMNSPETNAFAVPKMEDEDVNMVIITSALLEKLDVTELKFIIGHEIGHLISQTSKLENIIQFVFSDKESIPTVLNNKIELWKKLAELTADRFGFLAAKDFDKVVTLFFKLASGLSKLGNTKINPDEYLMEMTEILEKYKEKNSTFVGNHPVNPIRLKALEIFSNSKQFKKFVEEKELVEDEELDKEITELVQTLTIIDGRDLTLPRSIFMVTGGLFIANVDEELNEEELEKIINYVGGLQLFPKHFWARITDLKHEELISLFHNSIKTILKLNPGERIPMLMYLIDVMLADRKIDEKEINFLYEIGENILELKKKEIAQILVGAIQRNLIPRIVLNPVREIP